MKTIVGDCSFDMRNERHSLHHLHRSASAMGRTARSSPAFRSSVDGRWPRPPARGLARGRAAGMRLGDNGGGRDSAWQRGWWQPARARPGCSSPALRSSGMASSSGHIRPSLECSVRSLASEEIHGMMLYLYERVSALFAQSKKYNVRLRKLFIFIQTRPRHQQEMEI